MVLLDDTGEHAGYVLLTVLEPKTRFKSARHQCLRVDQPQFLGVLRLAFCSLDPQRKLWPALPSATGLGSSREQCSWHPRFRLGISPGRGGHLAYADDGESRLCPEEGEVDHQ